MIRLLLVCLIALVACASVPNARSHRTAAGFDAELHPRLLDAILAQRPHLLNGRGGQPPRVIINDEAMPTPIDLLNLIPTRDVTRIERRIADPSQVGNVPTLRIWVRIGPETQLQWFNRKPQVTPSRYCAKLFEAVQLDDALLQSYVRNCLEPRLSPPKPIPDMRWRWRQPERIA